MRAFADLPIRRKLSVAFMLTIGVVVVLSGSGFFIYEYAAFRRGFVESITTSARIAADNSTAAIAFDDPEAAQQILAALRGESQILAAGLYDQSGQRLATYQRSPEFDAPLRLSGAEGTHFETGKLICVLPVEEGNRRLGTLHLEASLRSLYSRWAAYGLVVVMVALGAAAVAWLLCSLLQRRIAGPIVELAATARGITERRDYSWRARTYGKDELGELALAFNGMLARIQEGVAAQERASAEILGLNAQLEQRVRERTSELQETNQELESFSYSVSHDLRAPLRHIQGYADMLVRATNGSLPEKARRYLQVITDASGEMGQLIDDLLAFSRMGRSDLREDVVDVGELIAEIRSGLEMATQGRRIVWQIEPLPRVCADRAMLKLGLANLIGNAVKFTRTRDPAEITIRDGGRIDQRIIIAVRDNGVGFDMTYYDKLFGVFQRLHRADEFEGTGIGLANVRRIITRHGGRVWAESEVDRGASFFFTLKPAESCAPNPMSHEPN